MDRTKFKEIYENYGERTYPAETAESVRRCHIPSEKKDVAYKDASALRKLTKQQATSDVIDFFNCLKRTYCGYDYFFTDETCDKVQNAILRKIKLRIGKIRNTALLSFLFKELYPILNDCHFNLYVCKCERFLRKNYVAYVTDIVLHKVDGIYEVVNENSDIPKGAFLTENEVREYLLPTLYVGDDCNVEDEYYLLGTYSVTNVKSLSINGKELNTHRILSDSAIQTECNRIVNKNGYVIVNHKSYGMPWNEDLLREYYNDGCSCSKSNAVILNLTGNGGGYSDYAEHFYEGLNGSKEDGLCGAYLPFPDELPDEIKSYRMRYPDENAATPTYEGTLYVVMNKTTASSAEMGVSPSYYVKNAIRIGSGTFGCTTFGNCFFYQLPHSKICLFYGNRLFYYDNFEEGKGFLPDYWIDDRDPVGVVEKYIKRKQGISFLKEEHESKN